MSLLKQDSPRLKCGHLLTFAQDWRWRRHFCLELSLYSSRQYLHIESRRQPFACSSTCWHRPTTHTDLQRHG